jgi:hypothetical protein
MYIMQLSGESGGSGSDVKGSDCKPCPLGYEAQDVGMKTCTLMTLCLVGTYLPVQGKQHTSCIWVSTLSLVACCLSIS